MAFPRYEIGDIIEQAAHPYSGNVPILQPEKNYYLILDKKFSATQENMADMYLTLCLKSGRVEDHIFQDSWYYTFVKVA